MNVCEMFLNLYLDLNYHEPWGYKVLQEERALMDG